MKVLAINGSPRKDGNTNLMLNTLLEPLKNSNWETELIQLAGKNIRGCIACMKCFERKNKQCSIKNDCINEIIEKVIEADAIVLGSPTYFGNVTAELKAVIDRVAFVSGANDQFLKGKIGVGVVAARRGGATCAFDSINKMYLMSQMIVPGSIYWNLGHGLERGDVSSDEEAMRNMTHLGEVINWLGTSISLNKNQYPAGLPV